MSTSKMRYCCWCGAELGVIESRFYDRNDTCGSGECDREIRSMLQAERDEAHEQLDRDMGWL